MTDRPDDIQRQIDQLEAMRGTLDAAIINDAIAKLQAKLPAQDVKGTATTRDNYGQNIGVNLGTVQQFFGAEPPTNAKELLDSYLDSLVREYRYLRLGKLLANERSGRNEATAPTLLLSRVYTNMTTNGPLVVLEEHRKRVAELRALIQQYDLERLTPDQVPPSDCRILMTEDKALALADFVSWHTMTAAQLKTLREIEQDRVLTIQITRLELVTEAIHTTSRLVLLGAPGSGKSTVLRYLVVMLAEAVLNGQTALPEVCGWDDLDRLPIPLFVQLGQIARHLGDDPEHDLETLLTALLKPVEAAGLREGIRATLLSAWRTGGVLLCLDGLDEVSGVPTTTRQGQRSPRERIAEAIRQLAIQIGDSRIVVTCRVKPYEEDRAWQLRTPWQTRTIRPFAFGQVRQFVPAWYAQTCLSDQPKYTADEAAERAGRLLNALEQRQTLRELTITPLLLTMLALLDYNNTQLPDRRVDVYEELVKLLLERWSGVRSHEVDRREQTIGERLDLPQLTVEDLRPVIHELAFEAHRQNRDERGVLAEDAMNRTLDAFFARKLNPDNPRGVPRSECARRNEAFVDVLNEETGLVQDDGDGQYVLPHLSFEEYLAACHLAGQEDIDLAYTLWAEARDRWREPLLLLMGRLLKQEKLWLAYHWVDLLASPFYSEHPKEREQYQRDGLFAYECYTTLGQRRELGKRNTLNLNRLEQQLRTVFVDILEQPTEPMRLPQRLDAGRALADLGDRRYPVTLDEWRAEITRRNETFGAPDGYWCYVRPGIYQIGGWEKGKKSADHKLPGFCIARYPITVAQYAAFIDDGGYQQQDYWTPAGWEWRQEIDRTQPWRWDNTQYNSPNQAVIGVTWYECMAFCAWLTAQLTDTGYEVRLPTEAEWEVAAAYDEEMQRHTYPWGEDEPTPEHAIFADDQGNNLGTPAPVGVCPAGAAACGALDMGGQVWEYCRSRHKAYPAGAGEGKSDFRSGSDGVPLRGGSWRNKRTLVRCTARFRYYPGSYGIDSCDGCRVLLSPRVRPHSR
jgi:formylglycine-generating enzyme required for sulfatase activity